MPMNFNIIYLNFNADECLSIKMIILDVLNRNIHSRKTFTEESENALK